MIPLRLTLRNFLSYRSATLDFRGLHVACICGENGAGKSSLLEAIAWVVWGQSRATSEDDIIHQGEMEAQVDFTFCCQSHTYRILRSRHRNQSSVLEFQIETPNGFRSLTGRGVRATQQIIAQHLKLDYDTFINSAYLRQGRADEFMLKRPSERKQILADLLKLNQYDLLAEQAKERSRQCKAEVTVLEQNLARLTEQIQQSEGLEAERTRTELAWRSLQQQQAADAEQLKHLHLQQQQRQAWQQTLHLQQQQQQHLRQDCQRLQQELSTAQQQLQTLEATLRQAEAIGQGYRHLQALQAEDEAQTSKLQAHQAAQAELQTLQQQQLEAVSHLKDELRQAQAQLGALDQQEQEIQQILHKADDIAAAVAQLRKAQSRLHHLDQLQVKAVPLTQRRQQLQTQLEQMQARLMARIEAIDTATQQLHTQRSRQPRLQQAVVDVAAQIQHLEAKRLYQQQVREKGTERRNFMERLQADQRIYETQLAELDHKIHLLKRQGQGLGLSEQNGRSRPESRPESRVAEADGSYATAPTSTATPIAIEVASKSPLVLIDAQLAQDRVQEDAATESAPPVCPLCDRPLDAHHWRLVLQHHQEEYREVLRQLWVVREQLAVSEREIQVLRQEYRDLEVELNSYGATLELRGRLQEQLHSVVDGQTQLQQIESERATLERSLQTGSYAVDLHEEIRFLDRSLQELHYDDRDHALARGDVDRWRWAEIKQAEIHQAQKRLTRLSEQRPKLEATIAQIEQRLQTLHRSPIQQQIDALNQRIAEIAYAVQPHAELRKTLREAQSWQLRHQELVQAQQQYPPSQQRIHHLMETLTRGIQELQSVVQQITVLTQQLDQLPDPSEAVEQLEQRIQERRSQLDLYLAHLGRLQQQQQQLEDRHTQHRALTAQLHIAHRQSRIYAELAQAFGKNGIQALMIENVLPQLEAETNQILGRLSANQLHVQFVTQRAGKRNSSKSHTQKLIDTLDIFISDLQGTRPYETYSGGEAFRVNFAIRLAMARLLAQRSGTALQMLIVDEGFGTQDAAGCERLVSAIQAIAADFSCILTVTHMPHLKAAFQTRIEVAKTSTGSCLQLVV